MFQAYGISVSQILGIVQNMEQLPDISRPGIASEEFHYLIVQGSGAVDILIGSGRQVVPDQFFQILHVHAEGRKLNHNGRKPVEEILPELIICDTLKGSLLQEEMIRTSMEISFCPPTRGGRNFPEEPGGSWTAWKDSWNSAHLKIKFLLVLLQKSLDGFRFL